MSRNLLGWTVSLFLATASLTSSADGERVIGIFEGHINNFTGSLKNNPPAWSTFEVGGPVRGKFIYNTNDSLGVVASDSDSATYAIGPGVSDLTIFVDGLEFAYDPAIEPLEVFVADDSFQGDQVWIGGRGSTQTWERFIDDGTPDTGNMHIAMRNKTSLTFVTGTDLPSILDDQLVTSTSFGVVTFASGGDRWNVYYGVDSLTIIPTPTAGSLLAVGLIATCTAKRRALP